MILIAIFQIIFSIGIVGFWIYFLLVENKNPERTKVYLVFEKSFILPDLGWVTPSLLISAFGLITHQRFWIFFSISAGSAIIFLFFLDFSFNVQQGNYKKEKRKENIIEIAVNIISAVAGPVFMLYGYINL